MDFNQIKSSRQVLDVFDDLFNQYSNVTELPKFKKRKLSVSANSKLCDNPSKLSDPKPSLSSQNGIQASSSTKDNRGQTEDAPITLHSKDQGSFSSGVFSIDSDIDNLNDEGDADEEGDVEDGRIEPEEKAYLSDTPSEAGSGVVERSTRAGSLLEQTQGQVDLNPDRSVILQGGAGLLTDDDVLFMMHKPRLKKKKKPPWQKHKLDIDDLWVKGQHLQSHLSSNDDEVIRKKLYLDRNLQQGKISLQNYICAMRKTRKGRKGLNNSSRSKSVSKNQSYKNTPPKDTSSKTLTSKSKLASKSKKNRSETLPASPNSVSPIRQSCDSTRKKQSLKCKRDSHKETPKLTTKENTNETLTDVSPTRQSCDSAVKKQSSKYKRKNVKRSDKSTRWFEGVAHSGSETSEQEFQTGRENRRFDCSYTRVEPVNANKSSVKKAKKISLGKSRETSPQLKATRVDRLESKRDVTGNAGGLKTSRKSRLPEGRRDSSSSKGNTSGSNSICNIYKFSRTTHGHPPGREQNSKTSSAKKRKQKKDQSIVSIEGSRGLCDDQDLRYAGSQESGGSQESAINFISLTPAKSRKLSRRKHCGEKKKRKNPLSTTTSERSDFDSYVRNRSLHPRGSLVSSDAPEWEDEEVSDCQSLFNRGKHCGGIWNSIVEEC